VKRALVLFALSGCAVGGSSSMVGRWKARRIVDSTACLQSQAPGAKAGCQKEITIGRDLPARRFQSLMFMFFAPGYIQQRDGDKVGHAFAIDSHFEYLRGKGGFAWGVRLGADIASGFEDHLYFMMPVSAVAHVGGLWGSVYAGAGYSPIALSQHYDGDMKTPSEVSYYADSVHAFVGTRFWLRRDLERGLSFDPEFKVQRFDGTMLLSVTGNIGLHF
jgi:hypothetical protein